MDEVIDSSPDTSDSVVSAATGKTLIKHDFLRRLPNSDDLFVAVPGTTGSGNFRVHGGAHNDNLYLFDGIDTTEPLTSMLGAVPYADTIETIEIMTGAFPAEYGRSMGGIVNAATRSGTNDFHGILRYKQVDSNTRDSDKWDDHRWLSDYDYTDYAVTIDGPIIRDKLWFMVSYHFFTMEETGRWEYPYESAGSGYDFAMKSFSQDRDYRYPMARLTFEPVSNHRIVLIYSGQSIIWDNYSGPQYDASPETYNTLEQTDPYYGVQWSWRMNPDVQVTAFIGGSFRAYDDKPTSGNDTDPAFYDTCYHCCPK